MQKLRQIKEKTKSWLGITQKVVTEKVNSFSSKLEYLLILIKFKIIVLEKNINLYSFLLELNHGLAKMIFTVKENLMEINVIIVIIIYLAFLEEFSYLALFLLSFNFCLLSTLCDSRKKILNINPVKFICFTYFLPREDVKWVATGFLNGINGTLNFLGSNPNIIIILGVFALASVSISNYHKNIEVVSLKEKLRTVQMRLYEAEGGGGLKELHLDSQKQMLAMKIELSKAIQSRQEFNTLEQKIKSCEEIIHDLREKLVIYREKNRILDGECRLLQERAHTSESKLALCENADRVFELENRLALCQRESQAAQMRLFTHNLIQRPAEFPLTLLDKIYSTEVGFQAKIITHRFWYWKDLRDPRVNIMPAELKAAWRSKLEAQHRIINKIIWEPDELWFKSRQPETLRVSLQADLEGSMRSGLLHAMQDPRVDLTRLTRDELHMVNFAFKNLVSETVFKAATILENVAQHTSDAPELR